MEFSHVTVLLKEAVDGLDIRGDGIYVDGTAGGGGHSAEILSRLTTGALYSIDQDPDAIAAIPVPVIEVHLSNIHQREEFRHHSVISPVVMGQIAGFGADSYMAALEVVIRRLSEAKG